MSTITGGGSAVPYAYDTPSRSVAGYGATQGTITNPGLLNISGKAGEVRVLDLNMLPQPIAAPMSMQALSGAMTVEFTLMNGAQLAKCAGPDYDGVWANLTTVAAGSIVVAPIQFFLGVRIKFTANGTLTFYAHR